MSKIESKPEIKEKIGTNCEIKADIKCPICNQLLKSTTTYNELNDHLKQCEYNLRDVQCEYNLKDVHSEYNLRDIQSEYDLRNIQSDRINIRQNNKKDNKNLKFQDMLDSNYINNARMQNQKEELRKSEPQRTTHKKRINSTNSSNCNTVNDFQLVIDYNNTENHDLYEEKLKNDGKKEQILDKYWQFRRFLIYKKNLMNFDLKVECKNYKEIFYAIKKCNIYYNTKFILLKNSNSNSPISKKPKILNLDYALNKYLDFMVKKYIFTIINNTLYFSFINKKVDYEMIGIILSILFIYPEIKLKYKLPLILCKLIVNQRLELNDIKYTNNEIYNSLYTLSKDKNIKSKGLVYLYEGNELLIDGKNIKVTNQNVFDYIEKIINYQFRKYKNEINIIKSNLFQFIPKKYIFYYNGEEIYCIINRAL